MRECPRCADLSAPDAIFCATCGCQLIGNEAALVELAQLLKERIRQSRARAARKARAKVSA
jgi:uncharacterized membrane protein YvbJ